MKLIVLLISITTSGCWIDGGCGSRPAPSVKLDVSNPCQHLSGFSPAKR